MAQMILQYFNTINESFPIQSPNQLTASAQCEADACPDISDAAADDNTIRERACDSLMMCIVTTLNQVEIVFRK
jgi:hypothetical protein